MAYTIPKTWFPGEGVTSSLLNTYIRDNQNAVSTHSHDGSEGEGNPDLLDVFTFITSDITTPDTPSSTRVVYHSKSGVPYVLDSLGAETAISLEDHTH